MTENTSVLTRFQEKVYGPKQYRVGKQTFRIKAFVRYDDRCGNGHNTFSITANVDEMRGGRWRDHSGGCCHDEVARHFPELAPLIKWHLTSSVGPLHYVSNTRYHASNRDYRGLLAGEKRHLRNGKSGLRVWNLVVRDSSGEIVEVGRSGSNWIRSDSEPLSDGYTVKYEPVYLVGEGKCRDLDAARRCAVWPEATDEDLTAPGLEDRLQSRLPQLMADFRGVIESLGFTF